MEHYLVLTYHPTITRPTSSIQKREEHLEFSTLSPPPPGYIYKDFQDFQDRITKLSLNDLWQFELSENLVIATLKSTNHVLPKFEVFIDNTFTFATLDDVKELATHVLVFLVKSIVNRLSYSLAKFATTGVKSFQIMPIFWKAVLYLEKSGLQVVPCSADGTSPNQKMFRIHKALECMLGKMLFIELKTFMLKKISFISFFCDVPHLIKTARNCISNSGSGRATRFMWNNGFFTLWSHISHLYHDDLESGLKLVNKLTSDHINLTPYSIMNNE